VKPVGVSDDKTGRSLGGVQDYVLARVAVRQVKCLFKKRIYVGPLLMNSTRDSEA
jgi:hypothetical protein